MDTLIKDLRYGLRSLIKQPGFTAVAVLSIALGIGVNTTIFSFVNAVLFRPLPFAEPDRLARVWDGNSISYPDYVAYRDGAAAFSGLAAYAQRPISLTINGESNRVWSEFVSGNYFDVLKANAVVGRTFLSEEDRVGVTNPVVVISDLLWRGSFNSDPDVVGKTISLNQRPYTVIGVMPEKFVGATVISAPDVWLPLSMEPVANPGSHTLTSPDDGWLMMLGRLRPDAKLATANAEVRRLPCNFTRHGVSATQGQNRLAAESWR
jgi:macrolide transport system ATP-binding/permease protein